MSRPKSKSLSQASLNSDTSSQIMSNWNYCTNHYPAIACSNTTFPKYPSLPDNVTVGFVAEPNCGRGTAGIIWSCLTVIVFSVWSTIHLNTKSYPSSVVFGSLLRKGSRLVWKPWKNLLQKKDQESMTEFPGFFWRKVEEALITLLFPEIKVTVAAEEFVVACYIRKKTRKIRGWEKFTLKQAHLVLMGGVHLPQIKTPETFDRLVAENKGLLDFDMFPTKDQISLRTKKDYFDKMIALFQGIYFISSCVARNKESYRFSLLERITFSYLVYALSIFLLQIRKPQELQEAFMLDLRRPPQTSHFDNVNPLKELWIRTLTIIGIFVLFVVINIISFVVPPWNLDSPKDFSYQTVIFYVCAGGFLLLWLMLLAIDLNRLGQRRLSWLIRGVYYVFGAIYICVRCSILFLSFWSFRTAPAGIYTMPRSWTRYLGHIGT